jgi:hypothetical protein
VKRAGFFSVSSVFSWAPIFAEVHQQKNIFGSFVARWTVWTFFSPRNCAVGNFLNFVQLISTHCESTVIRIKPRRQFGQTSSVNESLMLSPLKSH